MCGRQSAHYMDRLGRASARGIAPLLMVLLLLASSWSMFGVNDLPTSEPLDDPESPLDASARGSGGRIDVGEWRIGDEWIFAGAMDVDELVATAETVTSDASLLLTNMTQTVVDIYEMDVDGVDTLVYEVYGSGLFEESNVSMDRYRGDLDVLWESTDIFRVSDMAIVSTSLAVEVEFLAFDRIVVYIANMSVIDTYHPPKEVYDFPLRVGDTWTNNFSHDMDYSGYSPYFPVSEDHIRFNESQHMVVAQGNPNVPYGNGCANSYNATDTNETGLVQDYRWWCPEVNNYAWRHYRNNIGLWIDFKLKEYNPVPRDLNIDVDLLYPSWATDTDIDAWVNVTDNQGAPASGQDLLFRYAGSGSNSTITTDANGSAHVVFNTGHALDPSLSPDDTASHGVFAWVAGIDATSQNWTWVVGSGATMVLDDGLLSLDYQPRSAGVSVERTRDGEMVVLNPVFGFHAIPGDLLEFTVPVYNRGINGGPATELEVTAPDGSTSRAAVSALGPMQEESVDLSWTVPNGQAVGDVAITFTVDPDELVTADEDRTNNVGTFSMFIGRLPVAGINQPEPVFTQEAMLLDATPSNDPDGGSVSCTFTIDSYDNAIGEGIFAEDDCQMEHTWDQNGVYGIHVDISDEERDTDSVSFSVEVLNRLPWVNITSPSVSSPAESSITFDAYDHGDLDTEDDDSPAMFLWDQQCEEGRVAIVCTVTPMIEGIYTISLTAEDDDGATVSTSYDLEVTNIAPSEVAMTAWSGTQRLEVDSEGVWYVLEDNPTTLRATAHDSSNDMYSLAWTWMPDSDIDVDWTEQTTGADTQATVAWTEAGMHTISLEVVDDDGESSGVEYGQVEVLNVNPTVEEIPPQFPIGEDQTLLLTGEYWDTSSDIPSMAVCWDVDLEVDVDDDNNRTNDCDIEGAELNWSWGKKGTHSLRFFVTDDDGAFADATIDIQVRNMRPKAVAEAERTTVAVGEEVVIWSNGTTDSPSDMNWLLYSWDLDITTDSDGDGDPANDADVGGATLRHSFDSGGTKNIRLIIRDEEFTDYDDVQIQVTGGGILGMLGGDGGSPIVLGLVVVVLLLVVAGSALILMRRRKVPSDDDWEAPDVDLDDVGDVFDDLDIDLDKPDLDLDKPSVEKMKKSKKPKETRAEK